MNWFTPTRFAFCLGLLLCATFYPVLIGRMTFFYRDYSSFTYPVAWYEHDCLHRGELPLWNPYSTLGIPFLAQWNTSTLYPPSLFYLLLPLPWSLGVFQIAHLFLGGMGMFSLARRWTGSSLPAALAGLAFAFNGLSWHLIMWVSNLAALAWMPWVVLAVEGARTGKTGRALALASLAAAAQLLTGAPEIVALTWLFIGLLFAYSMLKATGPRWPLLRQFGGILLLAAGLSAAQLLPFFDFLAHSGRSSNFTDTDVEWALPSYGLANFLVPLFHCCSSAHGVFVQVKQGWATSYYIGIGVVALATLAVWRVRTHQVLLLGASTLVSIWLAMGTEGGLFSALKSVLPLIGYMRYPIKFVAFAVFTLPLLAAYGLSYYLKDKGRKARNGLVLIALVILGLGGLIMLQAWQNPFTMQSARENVSETLKNGAGRGAFLLAMIGLLVCLAPRGKLKLQLPVATGVLLVQWLDVYTHAPVIQPLVQLSVYEPGIPGRAAKVEPAPGTLGPRVALSSAALQQVNYIGQPTPREDCLFARNTLIDDLNLLDLVPKTDGFFSLYLPQPKRVADLLATCEAKGTDLNELKDFMAVARVGVSVAPGNNGLVWVERASVSPLISVGKQAEFISDEDMLQNLEFRPATNLRQKIFLSPDAQSLITATNPVTASVTPGTWAPQRVSFEVDSSGRAIVTIAQAFYHWWRASVDGQTVPLWKANYAFQALEVPPGKHRVTLQYVDNGFRCGVALSATFVFIICAIWVRPVRGSTRNYPPTSSKA